MLPKENRLTEKSDFQLLFKKGRLLRGQFVNFFYSPSPTAARVGFIVSNKISKLSVERNRLKRILRAEVYRFLQNKPEWRGMGVFVVLKQALNGTPSDISKDCQALIAKTKDLIL
jgi:ribonuclease P protein component